MNDAPQYSEAWVKIRLGRCTASRVADAMAKTKTGWGASRENYAWELAWERLTGEPEEGTYQSAAMLQGIEREPEARRLYSFKYDADVQECGFVPHPQIVMAGASPDGLIGDDGLLEIKCPQPKAHGNALRFGTIDGRYIQQMQWQMACTGRRWVDFVSYSRRPPESMRLWCKRIPRDDAMIRELETGVRAFLAEVEEILNDLRKRYPIAEAA